MTMKRSAQLLGTFEADLSMGFTNTISRPFKNIFTTTEGQRRKIEQDIAQGTYIGPSLERVRNPRAFYGSHAFIKVGRFLRRKYNENDGDVAKEVEQKSRNKFDKDDKLHSSIRRQPQHLPAACEYVAYVYNMDPLDFRTSWIADKMAPIRSSLHRQ